MRRNLLNYVVDTLALLGMLLLILTGIVMWDVLPPGSRGGHGLTLWGYDRHTIGDIHFWIAVALVALVILHVALHWDWVVAVTRIQIFGRKDPQHKPSATRQTVYGLIFFLCIVALVGGFWWYADRSVAQDERGAGAGDGGGESGGARVRGEHSGGHGTAESLHVRGSMTLRELAASAEVPLHMLILTLGLPADVSPDERLGHLRQQYGFDMEFVREVVADLQAAPARGE